ncbi:MAG: hypothetical protein Q8J90_01065, partial [Gallionella sp.]|nr:hypothetical protein [Gallionella sp.]
MKQLAIRLGYKQPQPSRWLSRKREKEQTCNGSSRQSATRMLAKSFVNPRKLQYLHHQLLEIDARLPRRHRHQ